MNYGIGDPEILITNVTIFFLDKSLTVNKENVLGNACGCGLLGVVNSFGGSSLPLEFCKTIVSRFLFVTPVSIIIL